MQAGSLPWCQEARWQPPSLLSAAARGARALCHGTERVPLLRRTAGEARRSGDFLFRRKKWQIPSGFGPTAWLNIVKGVVEFLDFAPQHLALGIAAELFFQDYVKMCSVIVAVVAEKDVHKVQRS